MNATSKTALIIVSVIFAVLLLLFGGGAMMGHGVMGGVNWMWAPTLLVFGLGAALVWVIFGQQK